MVLSADRPGESPPRISVVLPCYNESGNLPGILHRYAAIAAEAGLELILVDNGSTDGTQEILRGELCKPEYSFVLSTRVDRNIGYGHGIRSGLRHCRSEVVGYSHADLQCPPEDILRGCQLYQEAAGKTPVLVKGMRRERHGLEAFISRTYNHLSHWVLGIPLVDVNGQPKFFSKDLLPQLKKGPDDFAFDAYVLRQAVRNGVRIREFDVRYEARRHGQSKWAYSPLARFRGILTAFLQLIRIRLGRYD